MQKGFDNELKIVESFDNKKISELNDFQKELIKFLFGDIDSNLIIEAGKLAQMYKPDIYLKINGIIKYVSIKSGRSDSIHIEGIKSLILFLRSQNISTETQKIILLFHYGDGTLDGSGERRYEFNKILVKMGDLLDKANEELNRKDLIIECLYRFLFRGFREDEPCVDLLYYGDEKFGVYAKRDDIINFVIYKAYIHIKTLHIGPMSIQPHLRDITRISKHPEKREEIQVKWHYLLTDLENINNKYNR